jgi:hypothetical protein
METAHACVNPEGMEEHRFQAKHAARIYDARKKCLRDNQEMMRRTG